ncbi:MAG: thermonuclease family protein [Candidatus Omnitrophica bacterium]|nr:thermonuclease family protein [Candidatus Omnitrophota bacterium]
MRKPPYKLLFFVLAVGAALVAGITPHANYRDAVVARVYDGDTIQLTNGDKVRLIGIDTPELHDSDKLFADANRTGQDIVKIKAMGQRAYQFTNRWVAGQKVRLEFDVEKRDKYGRILAYVYLPFPRPPLSRSPRSGYIVNLDGKKWYFLNATIVQAGYAEPMTIPPNVKYAHIFQALSAQAHEYKLGLWEEKARKKK